MGEHALPTSEPDESGARPFKRPTGRRAITERQRAATVGLTGRFDPSSPGTILAALKRAAPALGLSGGVVGLIDHLMRYTRLADWQGQWAPIIWPSNAELADRLGLEVSRVKQLIRAALDAGLMLPRDHGTRKRFGRREGDRIIYAFGFDLSPLAERLPAFQRAAAEYDARIEEGRALRREVSRLRAAILALADYVIAQGGADGTWAAIAVDARELAAAARSIRDPLRLEPIAARLRALHERAEAALAVAFPVEHNPAGPGKWPHNTTTKQLPISSEIANTAVGRAQKGRSSESDPRRSAPAGSSGSALRGFPASPNVVLAIAPAFRDCVTRSRPTWSEISDAANYVRCKLGISPSAYGQACVVLGRVEAAVAVAVIAAKYEKGLLRSPGGLLRHMVDAHQAGTLRLDRTLFGLIDGTGGLEHSPRRGRR